MTDRETQKLPLESRLRGMNEHYEQEKTKSASEEMNLGNMNFYLKKENFLLKNFFKKKMWEKLLQKCRML